jgi:hypothetical protein
LENNADIKIAKVPKQINNPKILRIHFRVAFWDLMPGMFFSPPKRGVLHENTQFVIRMEKSIKHKPNKNNASRNNPQIIHPEFIASSILCYKKCIQFSQDALLLCLVYYHCTNIT